MKKHFLKTIALAGAFSLMIGTGALANETPAAQKPSPDKIIEMLKEGNQRFVEGKATHPHLDAARLALAGKENQANHAYATVLSCSDSRVPVEELFDAGVMDIFVVRVAGNVMHTDEAGSIEYGLRHVNTPVLVVLGHTQCGAVKAVTSAVIGDGHPLELNIPPLVDHIEPAVKRAMAAHPEAKGLDVLPFGIEENVWQSVEDLFMNSPGVREVVNNGKVKVVGAIYDVSTGKIKWLEDAKVAEILKKVEDSPQKAIQVLAGTGH